MTWISVATEGTLDVAVGAILAEEAGFSQVVPYDCNGKDKLDANLLGYQAASRFGPWLVIRDLNNDAECAPDLRGTLISHENPLFCFRVAVREIEAWLMADRVAFSRYIGVPQALVPRDPEAINDPKQFVANLARRSRRRVIRNEVPPRPGVTSKIGPRYTARLTEFATKRWNPERAATASQSLSRCRRNLTELYDRTA